MKTDKKEIYLFIVLIISFLLIFTIIKIESKNPEYKILKKIENRFNKVKRFLKNTPVKELENYEIFKDNLIKKWKGEILLNNIKILPENRFCIIDNETGIFLVLRQTNVLKILKLADYDFYTHRKDKEILKKGFEEETVDVEYIDYFRIKSKNGYKNGFIKNNKKILIKKIKGDGNIPLLIVKIKRENNYDINKRLKKKLFYLLYIYYFLFLFYYIIFNKNSKKNLLLVLLIIKIGQFFFYNGNPLEYFVSSNSVLNSLTWFILLIILYKISGKNIFLFYIDSIYGLFIMFNLYKYGLNGSFTSYEIYFYLFIVSLLLFYLFSEFISGKRKKIKFTIFIIVLVAFNFFIYEFYFNRYQVKYLDSIIKKMDMILVRKNIKIKKILKDYNSDMIEKQYNNNYNDVALSIFEKFIEDKTGYILPSIIIFEGKKIISYFSLSTPLPEIPKSVLSGDDNYGESFFKVKNFSLDVDYYKKIIDDKKTKIIVFFIKDYLKLLKESSKSKNEYGKYFLIYRIDSMRNYKLLKRRGKLFIVDIKSKKIKGLFYNIYNRQYFLGFPVKDFYYYNTDFIIISIIILLSFFLVSFFKYFIKKVHYSSFKVNFFIISIPLILSIIFQILFVNFFTISQETTIERENKNKVEILKRTIPFLLETGFNDKELCFYLYKISDMEILLFADKKLKFFSGILDYKINTVPYDVYNSLKNESGVYIKKINEYINIYFIKNKKDSNKYFGVVSKTDKKNSLVYLELFNKSMFYSTIVLIFAIFFSMIFSRKFKEGIGKIIQGLNLIKEGEIKTIEYDDSGEIGEIVVSFNKMVDNIKRQRDIIKDLTEKEALLKVARRVAHEIKNPLTPIKLNIEYLNSLKDTDSEEFEKSFSELMSSTIGEINKLEKVVKDFLNFSKEGLPPLYNFNLNDFLKKIVLIFKGTEVEFEFESEGDLIVYANEEYLETAVKNIIINSIEAIEEEKKIKISTRLDEGGFCELKIRDYGKGISSEEIDNIFKSGFSTKRGSGLGLSIVKEMIEKLRGEIKILSWKNEGTLVIIKLLKGE